MSPTGHARLVIERATRKRGITNSLKTIDKDSSLVEIRACYDLITSYFSEIRDYDNQVNAITLKEAVLTEDELSDVAAIEIDKQATYALTVSTELAKLKEMMTPLLPKPPLESSSEKRVITNCELKLPEMKCDTFTGEGVSSLQYHTFFQ